MSRPRTADNHGADEYTTAAYTALACLILSTLVGCGGAGFASWVGVDVARRDRAASWTRAESRAPLALPVAAEREGSFTLLTYNIAGLPQLLSPSSPRDNIPLISPLLAAYQVVLVQEDFAYHELLIGADQHAFRSRPMPPRSLVGDGLSLLSELAFDGMQRVRWERCHGFVSGASDCLADKGFSFSVLEPAPGVVLHLYNLHADAGGGKLDIEARARNFAQLGAYVRERSRGQAIIIAGDTNLMTLDAGDASTLARFIRAHGLRDACRTLGCWPDEPIDRVLYRGSAQLALSVTRLWQDRRFVDAAGLPLSDHPAIGAELRWRRRDPSPLMAHLGPP